MIVEVIPAIKLPRSVTSIYSYALPKEYGSRILVGQVVEVDFRGRKIQAVIVKKQENKKTRKPIYQQDGQKHKIKLKKVEKIITEQPIVTREQIELIFWMSEYYYISTALIMKSLVPKIPKKILKQEDIKTRKQKNKNANLENNKRLWFFNSEDEKLKKYKKEITKNLNSKQQTLIVVPTVDDLGRLKEKLIGDGFKVEDIINITAQQGVKEEFEKWLRILSGEPKVIISTKIGVLYPFNNLGSIIIDQSESWDYKQSDINPRYDTRTTVLMLGSLHECRVYFGSAGHRLEEINLPASKARKLKNKPACQQGEEIEKFEEKTKDLKVNIRVIDLKNVYKTKDFALISDELEDAIKTTLEKREKIFLFLNRKGEGTSTLCKDCGYVFKCENCQLPLVLHDENRLRCHYCNNWQDMPPFCPACHGPNIKSFGQGTGRVEKYLKKIFVGTEVLRLDSDKKLEIGNKKNKKLEELNSQIIIGTEYALNRIEWGKIGLVGVLNVDAGLVVPDFRAGERTYQLLRRIVSLSNSAKNIFLQTYNPDSDLVRAVENNESGIFYDEELKMREELGYPPFVRLIKLIYRDESKKKAACMADRLYRDLVKFQKKEKMGGVEVLEPVRAYIERVRGKYRYYIILKQSAFTKVSADKEKQLNELIKIVPDDWVVDVDPESLL